MEIKRHILLAMIAVTALSAEPIWAADSLLEVHQQGNISYVTGGIGIEENEELRAARHQYNLHIMSADKTGHFFGNSRVVISDLQHNVLLDVINGPIFYANLPEGKYTIEGYHHTQTKKQTITIANGKISRIRFTWPENISETPTH